MYLDNGIPLSDKEEYINTCDNLEDSQRHEAEEGSQSQKGHTV